MHGEDVQDLCFLPDNDCIEEDEIGGSRITYVRNKKRVKVFSRETRRGAIV